METKCNNEEIVSYYDTLTATIEESLTLHLKIDYQANISKSTYIAYYGNNYTFKNMIIVSYMYFKNVWKHSLCMDK